MSTEEHIQMEHPKRLQSVNASANEKSTNPKVARLQPEPLKQGPSSHEVKSEVQWREEGRYRFKNVGRAWACCVAISQLRKKWKKSLEKATNGEALTTKSRPFL